MKKIMSLVAVVLFSVSCASHHGAGHEKCGCGKGEASGEKACACGATDKKNCKCSE
ncbi:MAG: hypothetical protein R3A80_02250 [Bdellovibrionota bacterium]